MLYPSVTLKEATSAFMRLYNLTEEDIDIRGTLTTYSRMNKDFFNAQKQQNKEKRQEIGEKGSQK